MEKAKELDPFSIIINTEVGCPYLYSKRYEQAIEYLGKAIEMDPAFPLLTSLWLKHWIERDSIRRRCRSMTRRLSLRARMRPLTLQVVMLRAHGTP